MVSPNFSPDRENFRRKFSGRKIDPQIFAKFGENLTLKIGRFSADFSRPTKKKISKNHEVIFGPKIRDFPDFRPKNPDLQRKKF